MPRVTRFRRGPTASDDRDLDAVRHRAGAGVLRRQVTRASVLLRPADLRISLFREHWQMISCGSLLGKMAILMTMLASGACKKSTVTPLGTPELVLSEMKLGGASRVAKRIDADQSFGRSVMDGIATGDSLWLEVARNLTPASSAAEATLKIALASALPRAPDAVLSLLGEKVSAQDVCSIPFLESTTMLITTYHDDAVAALGSVKTPALAGLRDSCRVALDSARARKLARIDSAYIVKNKPVAPRRPVRRRRAR